VGVVSIMLLVVGAAVIAGSALGMALLDDPLDRIHLVTPASTVGVVGVCAAIVVRDGVDAAGTAALLTAFVTVVSSPFVTHATARSVVVRRRADLAGAADVDQTGADGPLLATDQPEDAPPPEDRGEPDR
jgi:multicomponent Na+:H+ antiporter subunit G